MVFTLSKAIREHIATGGRKVHHNHIEIRHPRAADDPSLKKNGTKTVATTPGHDKTGTAQ